MHRSHRIYRGKEEKNCTGCGEWKKLKCFGKRKDLDDGLQVYCKDCVKEVNAAREQSTPWRSSKEWLDAFAKKYNQEHPLDKWDFEFIRPRATCLDGVPAQYMVQELRCK